MEQKALLLLDNAPSHPSSATLRSEDGKIKTLFLPPNTTSIIQPMDQAVLDPLNKRYKRRLLHNLIIENELSELSVPEILKTITLKDVVYWITEAWSEASCDSLRKAWRNLLPEPDHNNHNNFIIIAMKLIYQWDLFLTLMFTKLLLSGLLLI